LTPASVVLFPLSRRIRTPHVTTLHGRLDIPDLQPRCREFPEVPLISISDSQRGPLPGVNWQALQALLGLGIDAPNRRVTFRRPLLPAALPEVQLRNLRVGEAGRVDLALIRHRDSVGINVLEREGDVEIVTVK
jgi:hypothetical protein